MQTPVLDKKPLFLFWIVFSVIATGICADIRALAQENNTVIQQQDLAEVLAKLPKNLKITLQNTENICQNKPGMAPEMVIIPAGSFIMGSPSTEKDRIDDEGPQHRVHIQRPFAIGRCEVTFADYDLFAKASGQALPDDEGWGRGEYEQLN